MRTHHHPVRDLVVPASVFFAVLLLAAWLIPAPATADDSDHADLSDRHMAESLEQVTADELLAEMYPAGNPSGVATASSTTHPEPAARTRPHLPSTGANR